MLTLRNNNTTETYKILHGIKYRRWFRKDRNNVHNYSINYDLVEAALQEQGFPTRHKLDAKSDNPIHQPDL